MKIWDWQRYVVNVVMVLKIYFWMGYFKPSEIAFYEKIAKKP